MRPDDGTQEWLEEAVRLRKSGYVDRRATAQFVDPNTIADPVLKEQMLQAQQAGIAARERYQNAWYAGPAHLGGRVVDRQSARDFPVDADVDQMSSAIASKMQMYQQQSGEDFSTDSAMQHLQGPQRTRAAMVMDALQNGTKTNLNEVGRLSTQQFQQPQAVSQPQRSVGVRLAPGHQCYRAMQTGGFGGLVLARTAGPITPQIAAMEVVVKQTVNAYVVPPNQQSVDIGSIKPHQCTQLVEVQSAMFGNFLVPREAVGGVGNQRAVLTDARMLPGGRTVINDSRQLPRSRGLLKG